MMVPNQDVFLLGLSLVIIGNGLFAEYLDNGRRAPRAGRLPPRCWL